MGFFSNLAGVINQRLGQKRQMDFAREQSDHASQLDMFSTAISAAEKAGDWDKVAQFTGLLGDFAQGGMGKKGKGKRDTALHAISDALRPVATEVTEKPADTTQLAEGSPEALAATRTRTMADLPKKTVTTGPFEAAYQKRREEKAADEERRAGYMLDRQEANQQAILDRQTARLQEQARIQTERDNRLAGLKANGKVNELAAMLSADPANAGKSPDELRALAGQQITEERLTKQRDMVSKVEARKATIANIASQITTRAGNLAVAQQNAASKARDASTRAQHESWIEKTAAIQSGAKAQMDGLNEANNRIGQLMTQRAILAVSRKDPVTNQEMTDEQVAARLRELDTQIGVVEHQRDQYGVHLQGYWDQLNEVERQTGAPPVQSSQIPAPPLQPMPQKDERVGQVFTGKDGRRYRIVSIDPDGTPRVLPAQ